ncbi:RNHCP domain-containing protein [Actinomadura sp. 21ATH]|uniref:RNHCP domain-containing protein n=1 Tax=Actinomadura sp. 21ATH TaxID=1735444 RepID=UPI0035BECD39
MSDHEDIPRSVTSIETFRCARCGLSVPARSPEGARRDHCPGCLHSLHLRDRDGGPSECRSGMAPISIAVPRDGDWTIVHRCGRCGVLASSPVRADDNRLILMRMAVRPLAQPPFPLEPFGAL